MQPPTSRAICVHPIYGLESCLFSFRSRVHSPLRLDPKGCGSSVSLDCTSPETLNRKRRLQQPQITRATAIHSPCTLDSNCCRITSKLKFLNCLYLFDVHTMHSPTHLDLKGSSLLIPSDEALDCASPKPLNCTSRLLQPHVTRTTALHAPYGLDSGSCRIQSKSPLLLYCFLCFETSSKSLERRNINEQSRVVQPPMTNIAVLFTRTLCSTAVARSRYSYFGFCRMLLHCANHAWAEISIVCMHHRDVFSTDCTA